MANTINTLKNAPGLIAKVAAQMLADKVQFVKAVDKESGFDQRVNGYDTGDTIQISKPARFTTSSTADITANIQDVVEEKVSLALDTRVVVPISLTSSEIATDLALAGWTKRILDPAVSAIAQNVEQAMLVKAKNAVANTVGTWNATVFDTDTMLSAKQKLLEYLAPADDGFLALLNPAAQRSAVNARKGLFQASDEVRDQYKKGYMGTADGFDYLSNNLLPIQTNGTAAVTGATITTTSTAGATTLAITGTGTQTITAGEVFTISGVNAVHPITKANLGYLAQFVATGTFTAAAGAYTGVTFTVAGQPNVYATTSLQNVSALPQSGANVVFFGTASGTAVQNLGFHKSFFRFASVPLVLPGGMDMAAQETVDGITVRVIRDYEVLTDRLIMRLDVLCGGAVVRPEWACRITA